MGRALSDGAPVRVLVVDDEPRFHQIARELIDATAGFTCVACAACGEQGIDDACRLQPDLVLMDVRMRGIGGLEAARRIASADIAPMVVLITADELTLAALDNLALEMVPKDKLSPTLLRHLWDKSQQGHSRSGASTP